MKNRSVENFKSRFWKWLFNYFPAYRRTGGRVIFISSDWKEVYVRLKVSWKTKNYHGTIFGGSLYSSIDPIYMMMFIKILGNKYIVWDKSAEIDFIKPVRKTVTARFLISDALIKKVKSNVQKHGKFIFQLPVEYVDKYGAVYVRFKKTLYVADIEYYKNRFKKNSAKREKVK